MSVVSAVTDRRYSQIGTLPQHLLRLHFGKGMVSFVMTSSMNALRRTACLTMLPFAVIAGEATTAPPRAARSVHLRFPAPDAEVFYNEAVVEQSTGGSYFMVCGWNTGYFGIQEAADHHKVILFSVWDPTKGDNPQAVKAEEQVECLYSAPDVRIRRFGGEGTGGQCMGDFAWTLGETNRFVVTGTVESNKTAYSGYVWLGGEQQWKQLVTFRVRTGGLPLRGLYSFVEDFRRDTKSVDDVRRARFGNGWVKTTKGEWVALAKARFTASNATWESKENINAGCEKAWFFLATGGGTHMDNALNSSIERDATGEKPPELKLPTVK
jgi:hypothetical protein